MGAIVRSKWRKTLPDGGDTHDREIPPSWEGPHLQKEERLTGGSIPRSGNYMALNSPEGIWPVRSASAACARTAARSAVDE